jgi:hypothetical protein
VKISNAASLALTSLLLAALGYAGCSSDPGQETSNVGSCDGAAFDAAGRCRLPNGQFAKTSCCEVAHQALEAACTSLCTIEQTCDYGPPADCVADCVGRGAACSPGQLEALAACVESYAECDDGENLGQCVDESSCLAPAVTPPDEKAPYEPECVRYCAEREACDDAFDATLCAQGCLDDCTVAELQGLAACNAASANSCELWPGYELCLRDGAACIAPPEAPVHEGEGPWGEACVTYCDLDWKCDYGYSTTCMADCTANESTCTADDLAALVECLDFYPECDDGENIGQCIAENVPCFAAP